MPLPYEARPSLAGGFAKSAAQSAYPELWEKLTLAIAPALGVAGSIVNLAGGAVLSPLNTSNYLSVDKGPALGASATAGTTGRIVVGPANRYMSEANVTIVSHYEKTDTTNRNSGMFAMTVSASSSESVSAEVPWSDGTVYWDFGGFTNHRISAAGLAFGNDTWVFRAGDLGMQMYQNGLLRANTATPAVRTLGGGSLWLFYGGSGAGQGTTDAARFRTFLIYDRNLTDREIQLLSRNPLAPFTLKQRERLPRAPFSGTINLSQSIGFQQVVDYEDLPVEVSCENTFSFTVEVEHNQQYAEASNTFNFTSLVGQDVFEYITQYLNFTPRTIEYASNFLDFDSFAAPVESEDVSNAFSFTQDVYQLFLTSNTFSFEQTIQGSFIHDVSNSFELVGTADTNDTAYERDGVQHCIKQHVSFSISGDPCREKNFSPMIGGSDDDSGGYEDMPTTAPTLTPSTLTLTYPFESPTTTMVFKNPGFGNDFNMEFSVLNRSTRGGDRVVFGDPKWAKSEVQVLQVDHVCNPNIDNYIAFVNESLGKEIGLLDWEGRQWRGIIIAPQSDIAKQFTGYSVQIVFRGELDE
jgi:hypothetical protein